MSTTFRRARSGLYISRGGGGSTAYRDAVLADSPLAYWRLGDASGTTATDSSGNSRSGGYANSPTLGTAGLVTGDSDTAVTFNGTNQYASVAYASWMAPGSFTIEALFKATSLTGSRTIASRWGPDFHDRPWALDVTSSKVRFFLSSGATLVGTTTVATSMKYHVAGVYDAGASTVKLYLNGTQEASSTAAAPYSFAAPFLMGALNNGGVLQSFFAGSLDEVAFYGAALSAVRIAAHSAAA